MLNLEINAVSDAHSVLSFPYPFYLAVGGFDGLNYLKSVEILDSENGSWRMCAGKGNMHYRRLGGGVGVVKLQNPFNYVKKETTR